MTLDVDTTKQNHRPIGIGLVGLVLLLAAGFVIYSELTQRSTTKSNEPTYEYTIKQSVQTSVDYLQNSFYENGPGATNTAYVTDLTDKINATFRYAYSASDSMDLTYRYDARATVRGAYSLKEEDGSNSNVWTKEFQLISPVTKTVTGKEVTVEPSVEIPFVEYKKLIDRFKTALLVPLNSEAVVNFTIRVAGTVDGQKFDDTRLSSVTIPLDQQIYKLAVKYDKTDTKQVEPLNAKSEWRIQDHYAVVVAGLFAAAGLALLVFGFRKQIFKTPYQRELDRIYRFHDGIIIRARKPTDLKHKNIVSVQSFDDMLNLEEELKVPIVASPVGNEATRFMIIHDDDVYAFVLGKALIDDDSFTELEGSLRERERARVKPSKRKKMDF